MDIDIDRELDSIDTKDEIDILAHNKELDSLLIDLDLTPDCDKKTVATLMAAAIDHRKNFSHRDTIHILRWINANADNPLNNKMFYDFTHEFEKQIRVDTEALAHKILDYIKLVESASVYDIKDYCKEERKSVIEAIEKLEEEGWLVKHRKEYKLIKKIDWNDAIGNLGETIPYNVPYFHSRAYFCQSDMILVGATTGSGKTHVAMNMVLDFVRQGIKPYYVSTESGSRHARVARDLGLKDGDYFWADIVSATEIPIEPNVVTIIDWLLPADYAETDKLFQHFANKMSKSGGLLIIFMQLRKDGNWFAENLCTMFPSFAARYTLNDDRDGGAFKIDKIRESKEKDSYKDINCTYNWRDKTLITIDDDPEVKEVMKEFGGSIK